MELLYKHLKTYLSLVSINKSKYQMADIGVKWMVAALAESAWRRNFFCPWFSIIEMHSTFVFYAVSVATENIRLWNNHWIRFKGWVTHRFWYAIRHNDARGWTGGWGDGGGRCCGELSLMTFWNYEKWSNFKAHEFSWTVNELRTCLIIEEKKIIYSITIYNFWT